MASGYIDLPVPAVGVIANPASGYVNLPVKVTGSNPVPTTTSLGTASNTMFADPATVLVNGTNFVPSSVVYVDGVAMTTAYVSASQLSATFSAPVHYPSASGTLARSVTVVSPAPGGGTSGAQTYTMSYSANVLFHVRADQGITLVTGVSQWNDLTANARHFVQAATPNQPLVVASQINGKSIVRFDGVDDFLQSPSFAQAQPYRFYAVGTTRSWTSNRALIGTTSAQLWQRGTTPSIGVFAGTVLASTTVTALNAYALHRGTFNGGSSSYQENNLTAFTGAAGAATIVGGVALGAGIGGSGPCALDLAEAIGWATPTAAEDTNYAAYCTSYYGVP